MRPGPRDRDRSPRPNRARPGPPPPLRPGASRTGPGPDPLRSFANRRRAPRPTPSERVGQPATPAAAGTGPRPHLDGSRAQRPRSPPGRPDDVTAARRSAGAAGSCSVGPRRRAHARRKAAARPLSAGRRHTAPPPPLRARCRGKRWARSAEAPGFLRVRPRRGAMGGAAWEHGWPPLPRLAGPALFPPPPPLPQHHRCLQAPPCPVQGGTQCPRSFGRASTGAGRQLGMELDPLQLPVAPHSPPSTLHHSRTSTRDCSQLQWRTAGLQHSRETKPSYKEMALLGGGIPEKGRQGVGAAPGRGGRTSIPLPAFANSLSGSGNGCCRLVEGGRDLVDVVEADHGKDEAVGKKRRGCSSCWQAGTC